MKLVFYRGNERLFELTNEHIESAEKHIKNGYPDLLDDFLTGKIIAKEENSVYPIDNCEKSDNMDTEVNI